MIRWLDQVTGRVTMYRLVLLALIAILVEAELVALTGQLGYDPLAILVVTAIAIVVSYASNRLFALIFRVRPHGESSIITGAILALLFLPSLSGLQLLAVALAAVFANAAPYVLALRGRHIFNPAAIGAFIAGLVLPSNPATWWVASPWLLPLVALGAFVILFRTRHLLVGIVAIVVAAASVTVQQVSFGITVGSAISSAFVSYPIVFFVGFMFSEPLTLPPRRWQQFVEAVIVGGLFGVTFNLGILRSSYQLWLVIGNLLAFLVGQRRGIQLVYVGREQLSPTSWELSFRPRKAVRFKAGQYMELTLPHAKQDVRGLRRTFSIASAPGDDLVRFGIRTATRSSSFKQHLLALQPGDTVAATAIGGDFVLPRDPSRPVLLVAGGIGVTPYVSHLEDLHRTATDRDAVLVYASSSSDDLAYAERLENQGHRVLLVAPAAPATLPANWTYLGAGPLSADLLLSAVPDARGRTAYVSGPPSLVRSLKPALRRAGVRRVHSDYFTGY
jgi:ferredoxin-NADP reductase